MLNKILAAIGLRRPKSLPITKEEREIFNKSKELIENQDPIVVSDKVSFSIEIEGKDYYFDVDMHCKYAWPADFLYMDYQRPELGGALYKIISEICEKRKCKARELRRAEFLGRENGGESSNPKPKPQAPPNVSRPAF